MAYMYQRHKMVSGVPADAIVKTDTGDVPIRYLRDEDLLWDGTQFVPHKGLLCMGQFPFMEYAGIVGTPGLFVYTDVMRTPVMLQVMEEYGYEPIRVGKHPPRKCVLPGGKLHSGTAYTVLNAGPEHRFMCQGVIIHNMTV